MAEKPQKGCPLNSGKSVGRVSNRDKSDDSRFGQALTETYHVIRLICCVEVVICYQQHDEVVELPEH